MNFMSLVKISLDRASRVFEYILSRKTTSLVIMIFLLLDIFLGKIVVENVQQKESQPTIKQVKSASDKKNEEKEVVIEQLRSISQIPTATVQPTQTPIPPTAVPQEATYADQDTFRGMFIDQNNNQINLSGMRVSIINQSTNQTVFSSTSSPWGSGKLQNGWYKVQLYDIPGYVKSHMLCVDCMDKTKNAYVEKSDGSFVQVLDGISYYGFFIKYISASVVTPTPTAYPTSDDHEAPTTNILYPQDNGEIAYKTDGKVCAVLNPPSDNATYSSSAQDYSVSYAFDGGSMSEYTPAQAYLCGDLPNGPHTLSVSTQDKAGNKESPKTIHFTVNIP